MRKATLKIDVEGTLKTLVKDKDGRPSASMVHLSPYSIPLEFSRQPYSPLAPAGDAQGVKTAILSTDDIQSAVPAQRRLLEECFFLFF